MNAVARLYDPAQGARVYLGLGTNISPRRHHLQLAAYALAIHPEILLTAASRIYASEYVGPGRQAEYLNGCVELRTHLSPRVLLAVCKGIEARLGRPPGTHQLPRTIDLDLLVHEETTSRDPELTLPHPRLHERGFVLEPLAELIPGWRLPDSGETVQTARERIRRRGGPWVRPAEPGDLLQRFLSGGEKERRAAVAVHRH
jgi:2-amino-4-hydroxy-6-hydroxymethyldihydropteridine diphosphokinase